MFWLPRAGHIGIVTKLVTTRFMRLVGTLALAPVRSLGLGGREMPSEIVRKWYPSGQQAMDAPEHRQRSSSADGAGT